MKLDIANLGINRRLLNHANGKFNTPERVLTTLAQIGNADAQAILDALDADS